MAELGPWMITAHNKEQAEYLVRSRAEQRGVDVSRIDVSGGSGDMWLVTVTVSDAESAEAARLAEDTQVLHLPSHTRPGPAATR
jgi:ribosomal protein L18E